LLHFIFAEKNYMTKKHTSTFETFLEQAKNQEMDILGLLTAAELLTPAEQIELYETWIKHSDSPVRYAAYFNLAVILDQQKLSEKAEQAYRDAIEIHPDFIQGQFNLGATLERQNRIEEALNQWRGIISKYEYTSLSVEDQKIYILALNSLGRVLETERQFQESEQFLTQSLLLNPDQPKVISHWVHLRQKQCEWPVYKSVIGVTKEALRDGTSALAMLSATNDPQEQLNNSLSFVEEKVTKNLPQLATAPYNHDKIRIGYLSSDFRTHAVSLLTVELYELHDREKFEIYGFCFTPPDDSALRARVMAGMDKFISVADMSDEEAARCIHSHEIDLLVDLQGLTSGVRPNILAYRPAPVQATYLGFPGTTALPNIDYVIGDEFLIPLELAAYFTETVLHMPRVFQVSDRKRPVGEKPTRASNNLPDDAFVFCCFNNNYKITEEMFACWMRILKRVPNSVLWLLADNEWAHDNMVKAAIAEGIDKDRLIFASRVAPADYLARYQIADVFLDCTPFNGGTTANDALFMGLPILTLTGKTFASRMAGSLLHSLGLDELITYNLNDYEEKAVWLAENQHHVADLRKSIEARRNTCDLFNMPQQVRDIEALYEKAIAQGIPNKQIKMVATSTPINQSEFVVLSLFYGIVIRMKRNPKSTSQPHIHADFQGSTARITLNSIEITQSNLPTKQERLVLAWVEIHRDDLLANWDLVQHGQMPVLIDGLK
jgi:predicted O-linked N-acetylglucosamine transferase (SPINDLY family)